MLASFTLPLEQLRIELQPYLSAAATLCIFCCHR